MNALVDDILPVAILWAFWLLMFVMVVMQWRRSVAWITKNTRPCHRSDDPKKFWTSIIYQIAVLAFGGTMLAMLTYQTFREHR